MFESGFVFKQLKYEIKWSLITICQTHLHHPELRDF